MLIKFYDINGVLKLSDQTGTAKSVLKNNLNFSIKNILKNAP